MRTRRTQTPTGISTITEDVVDIPVEKPAAGGAETKAEAFKRVANFRLEKTIARLRQFPALSNSGSYEYTDDQVEFILGALNAEVEAIAEAFKDPEQRSSIPQL